MANEHGFFRPRIAHHGKHRASKEIRGVTRERLVALAMARQINENKARLIREHRDLLAPEITVAGPAVDEQDCLLSFADREIVDFVRPVGGEMRSGVGERIGWFPTLGRASAAGS